MPNESTCRIDGGARVSVASPLGTVITREGQQVAFDAGRIRRAILKAAQATGEIGETDVAALTRKVVATLAHLASPEPLGVESIQDVVEDVLLSSPWRRTAKAYILYREQHARLRELSSRIKSELVETYLDRLDWQVSENANMAFSLQGLNNFVSSEVSRTYWLERVYPPEIARAHQEGDLHIHDLNLLAPYCVGWDLADLLTEGFRGAPGKVESRPARHFRSALGQMVNFFYTLQGEAAGAQAFSNVDTYLAPFIRHDRLEYAEVKQALQEFIFSLNVPTRVGFQTPFTNVTLDLEVPPGLEQEPVIWGGQRQEATYREFQPELDLFNQAFLEVMAEGDACGRPFTFPIPTYNITPDFDYDDPRLDRLWEVTARYGIPYFANYVSSELRPEDARSMCCRLRLDTRELARRGGGVFGPSPLTGSVGVVTLNLPRLGYLSQSEADFGARLDRLLELAAASLELKRKVLERLTERQLYPYCRFYLRRVKQRHGRYWHNHFSTIGIIGLNEACLNLFDQGLDHPRARAFGLRVLDQLRARLADLQQRTGHLYNLEATPAEGASYRLALLDKQRSARARCANERAWQQGAAPFYTGSSQLPVDHSDDIFAVLEHQDEFHTRYTGGTVQHVFVGETISDPRVVKEFLRTVFQRYRLPYLTLTPTFSVCQKHGFVPGEEPLCPVCGEATEVYSRVVGYLRPVSQWNAGKQAEFSTRKSFVLAEERR